ncbi:MFS transporter [Carboxylicivirga linearis]|uniref:MFS transporter n=1 Tax=Carboxylicivirga linearis TaxID=1628157 RepID=A0ABS5JYH4_9BACT|nr:MFS transporter [Carboxylicivirga linearis]MBS2099356.1 MFS transporter [Carboxylicivirga linearis]
MTDKVTLREKIGYGFGDAASSIYYKLFTTFLIFFYTDVFGISAAAAGTMILITRLWDAFNDLIMGAIADRTKTKWGKFRPYMLWFSVPLAVVGVATFTSPDITDGGKLIYAYISYSLLMMIYTAINVPYSSLIGVMTSDSVERTSLASYRYAFAFGGGILVQGLLLKMAGVLGGDNEPLGWQLAVGVFAILSIVFFLITFFWTKERVQPKQERQSTLKDDLKDLLKNKEWFVMLAVGVFTVIFNQLREGAAVYYLKYYFGGQDVMFFGKSMHLDYKVLTGILVPVWTGANILGVFMATWMAKTIGKKKAYTIFMLISLVASLMYYPVAPGSLYVLLLLQIFVGVAAGLPIPLMLAMFGDIADYSEWKTGRRATGLIFSSISMSQKFGSTIGIALTGYILASFGYTPNEVTAESQSGIRIMMSFVPAIAAGLSVVFLWMYKLNEPYMAKVKKDLDER